MGNTFLLFAALPEKIYRKRCEQSGNDPLGRSRIFRFCCCCNNNSGIQVDGKTVSGANFRTSNGVCFDNWHGVSNTGQLDGVIDPNCEGASNGYVIRVFRDGKITVPETVSGYANQSKAYAWLQKQAEITTPNL